MTQLQNLTNYADQLVYLNMPDGTTATLELIYAATCQRWWANVVYAGTTINGLGLCTFPNLLRQWKNILPFGLAVDVADESDPFNINDFISTQQYPGGRVTLFWLSPTDVQNAENTVFGTGAAQI